MKVEDLNEEAGDVTCSVQRSVWEGPASDPGLQTKVNRNW